MGTHEEIRDICTWKRVDNGTKEEFDKPTFKMEYPDLYAQYYSSEPTSAALIIHPFRAYPFS